MNKEAPKAEFLELITGTTKSGKDFYAYVGISNENYLKYLRAKERMDPIDINSLGTILASGYGTAPPDEIRKEMEAKYGVNHNFENDFDNELNKQLTEAGYE